MKAFWALLCKDLKLELRAKETLAVMLCLSLLSGTILSFGFQSVSVPPDTASKLYPMLLWFLCVFSAATAVGRTYEYELQLSAVDGVLLSGTHPSYFFLAKACATGLLVFIAQACSTAALAVLLDVSLAQVWAPLLLLTLLVVAGYAALATLVAAIAATSRLKSMLLPLILLPLLAPLFFAAVELTADLFARGALDYESVWFSLLLGLDLLYFALGINLFEFVIRD